MQQYREKESTWKQYKHITQEEKRERLELNSICKEILLNMWRTRANRKMECMNG